MREELAIIVVRVPEELRDQIRLQRHHLTVGRVVGALLKHAGDTVRGEKADVVVEQPLVGQRHQIVRVIGRVVPIPRSFIPAAVVRGVVAHHVAGGRDGF